MEVLQNVQKWFWAKLFLHVGFLQVVFPLFFLSRGLTYLQTFGLMGMLVFSIFLFEVPTGMFSDRFGRKASLCCGLLGNVLFNIGLLFASEYWMFLGLYLVLGLFYTFLSGSDEALIYDSLKQAGKEKEMQGAWGKISTSMFMTLIITAPIAGFIAKDLSAFQFNVLIVGHLIFGLASLLVALTLVEPQRFSSRKRLSFRDLFVTSLGHIRKNPILIRLFLNKGLIFIVGFQLFRLLWPGHFLEVGLPVWVNGVALGVSCIMLVIFLRKIDWLVATIGELRFLFWSALVPAAGFFLAFAFSGWLMALVFFFVVRVLVHLRAPVFSLYMNEHIESHNRATVLSSLSMFGSLFDIVLFLIAGRLADVALGWSLLFSGGIMIGALVFFPLKDEHIKFRS